MIPACEPVNETASSPRSWIAIATRAHAMRSPVERSMSISRGFGSGETSFASAISESVVLPIADTVPTTRRPLRCASTNRRATFFTFSGSATEEPPNFITTVSKSDAGTALTFGGESYLLAGSRPERRCPQAATGRSGRGGCTR